MGDFVPDRGNIVWLSFNPQAGHEQAGRRPALVLSPKAYNAKTSLCLACPVTHQVKGYPFEVRLPSETDIQGVILADQIRSLDWRERRAELAGTVPSGTLDDVMQKVQILLGFA